MDIVGWFLLSSTSFQKFEDVCSATSSQSFPSTPHHYGSGLAAARNNNPILLRHIHALLYFFLRITSVYCLHKISSVLVPGGFRRTARTYTTDSASDTS